MISIKGSLWLKELTQRWKKVVKPNYEEVLNYLYGKTEKY